MCTQVKSCVYNIIIIHLGDDDNGIMMKVLDNQVFDADSESDSETDHITMKGVNEENPIGDRVMSSDEDNYTSSRFASRVSF